MRQKFTYHHLVWTCALEKSSKETWVKRCDGKQCPETADNLNAYLQAHFPKGPTLESPDAIRDHLVERISEWNDEWQPKSLLDLFEGFLKRMPLHRLAHFLDMILPQLSPMHTRWDDPRKTLLCCHFFRLERAGTFARVRLQFLFTSRALIYMVRIGTEDSKLFHAPGLS